MDNIFLPNNSHWYGLDRFESMDPNLLNLQEQPLVHKNALLDQLPIAIPGIYTLGGGRQIGKSTLLKQWMSQLMQNGVNPKSIVFISGEFIQDHHALIRICQSLLEEMEGSPKYLIIDEVTYIKEWDKAIKYAADIRLFKDVIVILTGSDLTLMKQARMTFPGRRGVASKVNFHLYPLSFREYFGLVRDINVEQDLFKKTEVPEELMRLIYESFNRYLMHGGFLTAINDLEQHGKILASTLMTYAEWIRGDVLKRGKSERYLKEILSAIIQRYSSQVSWNALTDAVSIDHPNTVADYCHLLESMDALFIQQALLEDKLVGAPKKARKLMFKDPFIFHAINYWLNPSENPYEHQILTAIEDKDFGSKLVEACVVTHFGRYYPTYYIKASGEIDVAYIDKKRFWPVEVKWRNQLRPKDVKQIGKYKNARILSHTDQYGAINDIPIEPLPLALLALDSEIMLDV